MKYIRLCLAIVLALGSAGIAIAAVTAEEAGQLGTSLTALGAEKAANADGSIPEFTNIPIKPPADYQVGSGRYTDPFPDEKPLFSIDAGNLEQYADKLSEGAKLLFKRWPSYRIDVYPTHRSGTYSKWVGDNTIRNATSASLADGGMGVEGGYGGPPFPIPKSGLEVIWNSFLHPMPVGLEARVMHRWVDATGRPTIFTEYTIYHEFPYYDPERTSLEGLSYYKYLSTQERARDAGGKSLGWYSINYAKQDLIFWSYSTGQRRTSIIPGYKYDTPGPAGSVVDEFFIYSGPPDLYDWKLIGKREMYVPYNAYRAAFGDPEKVMTPEYFNPDALRWEKHRVWVVDGTLKPSKKHSLQRRTIYVDEDSWTALMSDGYDNNGRLNRVGQSLTFPIYEADTPGLYSFSPLYYDMFKDGYLIFNDIGDANAYLLPAPKRDPNETTADSMGGSGIR